MSDSKFIISPNGDLNLVVGAEKVLILVQSLCLKQTSKVFATMLGPNFKEGHDFAARSNAPGYLSLPVDDAANLRVICAIVHGRNDMVDRLSLSEVLDIALLADKYDFIEALRYASESWVLPQPLPKKDEELMLLAGAAYMLKSPKVRKLRCVPYQSFSNSVIVHDLICILSCQTLSIIQH